MPNAERVSIYIDGGNFHHLVLKKLSIKELDFAFDDFVKFLVNDRSIVNNGKRFYVGTIREQANNPRSKLAMSKQTKFFTILKSFGWEIKTSKLRTRTEKIIIDDRVVDYQALHQKGIYEIKFQRMRENGIDVKLAIDLIIGAVDDKYDTAIIVSSDADLTPAMDWIRQRKGKKVEYVGFSLVDKKQNKNNTKPLETMFHYSDIQRVLVESDLKKFILHQA
ncbi:MAG: NYN domain-containing protein [bacterium]